MEGKNMNIGTMIKASEDLKKIKKDDLSKKKQDELKTFDVVISEQTAKTIRVDAKNIDDAENIVNEGKYDDSDIIDEDTVDWMIVDSEEIKDDE